jgi:ArsR family transcriptional regulator
VTEAVSTGSRKGISVERTFRALADPTRVRILHLLFHGPLCVGDLVALLAVPQPTASRHLAYLRSSGLVVDERRGQWSFYEVAPAAPGFHRRIIHALRAAASTRTRADEAALAALRRTGGCCPQHARPSRSRKNGR